MKCESICSLNKYHWDKIVGRKFTKTNMWNENSLRHMKTLSEWKKCRTKFTKMEHFHEKWKEKNKEWKLKWR
jgi:hypothetical protein